MTLYNYTVHMAGRIAVMCSQGALYNATLLRSWVQIDNSIVWLIHTEYIVVTSLERI